MSQYREVDLHFYPEHNVLLLVYLDEDGNLCVDGIPYEDGIDPRKLIDSEHTLGSFTCLPSKTKEMLERIKKGEWQ